MKAEIYYFSGTGNSLQIAKEIATKLPAKLTSIPDVCKSEKIKSDASVIGIVFPVYYGNLPNIIREFSKKLDLIEGKYIFVVANFGGGAGVSIREISKIIISKNGKISAKFAIQMPQNSWLKTWENREKLFEKCKLKIEKICKSVSSLKKVRIHSNIIFDLLQITIQPLFDHLVKSHFIKITKESKQVPLQKLIYLTDRSFIVKENCDGCGLCSKVCPTNNIKMENSTPTWLHRCENCLACYNFCPKKSIKVGIMQNDFYYLNPAIKLSDFIKKKSNNSAILGDHLN
ncbi:MAG: EFR1 family ferrodoxin [Bacteroidales bacterium]|nr:EFR1 family ferrodoxin [Bacteroidales bacterium]